MIKRFEVRLNSEPEQRPFTTFLHAIAASVGLTYDEVVDALNAAARRKQSRPANEAAAQDDGGETA